MSLEQKYNLYNRYPVALFRRKLRIDCASSGQTSIWEMNGNSLIGGGPVSPNPGLA